MSNPALMVSEAALSEAALSETTLSEAALSEATLEGFQTQAKTETAYYQLVSDYLNSQENVEWDSEEHTAEYVKAFSDTQSLAVKISCLTAGIIIG